ncbi:MAG: AI-2E family transporter [Legionellales bacterium]|nr:AI-2E family transporter [Legionellales bacterium]
MIQEFKEWYNRFFAEADAVMLCFSLIIILLVITLMGRMLAPALVSLVLAYLLQALITPLEKIKVPHWLAVLLVFILFLGLVLMIFLGLLPTLWQQSTNLINEIPFMITRFQQTLMHLPEKYPDYVTVTQVQNIINESKIQMARFGQWLLSFSISSIPNIIELVVYLVLVPLLIYFFLMDKLKLITWFNQYLPKKRRLILQVWQEVNLQIGNYVRGKIIELIIVGITAYLAFAFMNLSYAMLLAALVGASVIIPYIGAIVVTVPVVVIALIQWGLSAHFFYLLLIYTIIMTVDANILVPVLFSEIMDLHPVAIIIAILIFGGIWGFWGVFFAIPLATVVKAVLTAWPRGGVAE